MSAHNTIQTNTVSFQAFYRNICVLLDGVQNVCTPSDRTTYRYEEITLEPTGNGEVTTISIIFPSVAIISKLEIIYNHPQVDPCLTDNGGCDDNAFCTDVNGVTECSCNPGYVGDGHTCIVDPCLTDNGGCDDNASCTGVNGVAECACNSGYTGDGATCIVFPCPSEECWTYVDGRCDFKESCGSVSCTGSGLTVTFNEAAQFSLDGIVPTPVSQTVTIGGSDVNGFIIQCAFGDCGMTFAIENDLLKFTLPMQATANGNSGNVNVGGLGLSIGSVVPEARFQCSYPTDVEVASGSYEVLVAPVTDSSSTALTGSGTLEDQVSFTFNNVGTMNVGSLIEASIALDLQAVSGLTFALRSCRVQTSSTTVNIVEGGCYSRALSVKPISSTDRELTVSYMAFTAAGAFEKEEQDLTCTIRICMSTCTRPITDDQCPTSGNAASYQYTTYYDLLSN